MGWTMAASDKPREVLALQGALASLGTLATGLRQAGLRVDLVEDLEQLRDAFFSRGGHDALLVGPDVHGPVARRAIECLAEIDQAVQILVFGSRCGPEHDAGTPSSVARAVSQATAFHPSSRAGLGAVLRLLRVELPHTA
jgi:hypothetical protein